MLVANAENLMKAVVGTLKAAEAASVKVALEKISLFFRSTSHFLFISLCLPPF